MKDQFNRVVEFYLGLPAGKLQGDPAIATIHLAKELGLPVRRTQVRLQDGSWGIKEEVTLFVRRLR